MALAGRAENVRAPHEHVARPVVGMIRVLAGQLQFAGFERLRHIVLGLEAGGLRLLGEIERVLPQLRRRRQPAHTLGAHVVVDQRAVPGTGRRGRRDQLVDADGLVAPLIGVRIEERGGVLLARRPSPVEREGERQPARLRPQLFLADIMRPAAAGLADATAQHQHVDGAAVVHVAVEPMVHGGADDDHRAALGLLGIEREFARHRDDLVARHAADLFRPGRRIGLVVVVGLGDMLAAEAAIEAVIGGEQVEHRGDQRLAVLQFHPLGRHFAHQHAGMVGAGEIVVLAIAEIGEADVGQLILVVGEGQPQVGGAAVGFLFLQIPFALLAPAEADRAGRRHDALGGLVEGDGLPFRIVGLAEIVGEIGGAQLPVRHEAVALLHQLHQHRHVGVLPDIVLEILGLLVEIEFAQDDVAHRHGERRVGALLHRDPQVGEFRGFRIVRADHHALGAAVARLGIEVRIGRAGLRDIRAPQNEEAGIVPVGALGHVGLLAPGLRTGRRQVAIPVVERHAHAAEQRQITRARGIGHHRHRRDRREADDAVGPVLFHGVGIGRRDDLGDLVPGRAHEAAEAALAGVGLAFFRILDDRPPGGDRRAQRPRLAPELEQARAHQRIFHAIAGIQVPGVARPARTAARLVVGQLGPRARIVGLLRLPGDDAALDVDFPRARAGAIGAVGRAHDLVVLPALAVAVLPAPVLVGGDAVAVGETGRRRG